MSDNPRSGPMHGQGAGAFPSTPTPTGFYPAPSGPPPWQPAPPHGQSRWLTYVALAVAFIATGIAIAGWFRPAPSPPPAAHPSTPTYTEQQIADAKAKACAAFQVVQKGVRLQTGAGSLNPEPSDNAALTEAQSANARLSVIAGSSYLRERLDPATPSEVANSIRNLSESMSELGEKYIAGAKNDDPEVNNLRSDGSSMAAQITELCK